MTTKAQDGESNQLDKDEESVFERLQEIFEDDEEIQRICDLVLQSSDDASEEANS